MDLYNLMSGITFVGGGIYAFLAGTGRIEIKPGDPEGAKKWRDKYGRFMAWAGPVIALSGVLHFFGIL